MIKRIGFFSLFVIGVTFVPAFALAQDTEEDLKDQTHILAWPLMTYSSEDGESRLKVFPLIIASLLERDTAADASAVRFVNVLGMHLAEHTYSEDERVTRLVEIPFAQLFENRVEGSSSGGTLIARVLWMKAFENVHTAESNHTGLIDLGPIKLLNADQKSNGTFEYDLVELPIFGSLLGYKRIHSGDEVKSTFNLLFLKISSTRDR